MVDFRVSRVAALAISVAVFLATPSLARAQGGCGPLPPPPGTVINVSPSEVDRLQSILDATRPGDTVQFADGLYALAHTLVLRTPRVTMRSQSGNRDGVVLDGRYVVRDLILVQQSDVTIADLTLTRSYWHLVHVVPGTASLSGTTVHNVRGVDGGEQFVKVNPAGEHFADHGVVRCSSFEMTDAGRASVRNNCYTGGIDIHQARGWQIYANTLSGFWCDRGLAEHAIHAWSGSRDTLVERNIILNSARGIGLGLGQEGARRSYDDLPCPGTAYVGHYGGAIVNNFVAANDPRLFDSRAGFDTGIGLEQSCETAVLHNTIAATSAPRSSSIEWRFANTTAVVANNLVTHRLLPRDGGRATEAGNVIDPSLTLFVDFPSGNLRLLPTAIAAIDKAAALEVPLPLDIDGESRGLAADVGADEYMPATAPAARPHPLGLPRQLIEPLLRNDANPVGQHSHVRRLR